VLVTPKLEPGRAPVALAASEVSAGAFRVIAVGDANPEQAFYWEVKATRADVAPLRVELSKAETEALVRRIDARTA
jgi:hypothetical protein